MKNSQYCGNNHCQFYDMEMKSGTDFGSSYMAYDGVVFNIVDRKNFINIHNNDEWTEKLIEWIKTNWIEAGNIVRFKIDKK